MFRTLIEAQAQDLQNLSQLAIYLFAYVVICVVAALTIPMSRRAIRFTVVSGLTVTGFISLLSGYLYVWHHWLRA